MRKLILFAVILFAGAAVAQTPVPSTVTTPPALVPLDPTPIIQSVASNAAWTTWAQTSITTLGQNQAADRVTLAQFTDQSATINTLRGQLATLITQLTADEARITALETKLAATQSKVAAAGTTLATP